MVRKDRKFNRHVGKRKLEGFRTLYWLNVEMNGYRRIYDDMSVAMSMMGFFFPSCRWLESEEGTPYRDSLLLNQVERAKILPDRRRHDSSKCMPKEHRAELDKLLKMRSSHDTRRTK